VPVRVQGYDFDEPDAKKLLKTRTPVDVGKSIINTQNNFALYSTNTEPHQNILNHVETFAAKNDDYSQSARNNKEKEKKVVIVESRMFLRECIQRWSRFPSTAANCNP
jgi:hypothetical protein